MPLLDDISEVPYSTAKGYFQVVQQFQFSACVILGLSNLLQQCDWTLLDTTPAVGTIAYPLGYDVWPYPDSSGVVGCGSRALVIQSQGQTFVYSAYVPGQSIVSTACIGFALGATVAVSLGNLCAAINATNGMPYSAALSSIGGVQTITLTAKTAGPFSNFDQIFGDGRYGITSGLTSGGGYVLESDGASPYQVAIYGVFGVGVGADNVQFDFTLGPSGETGLVSYQLNCVGVAVYNMCANPFSFAIFDGVSMANSLAAFAPDVEADEGFSSAYAVAIAGPNTFSDNLLWAAAGNPSSQSLDAAPITTTDSVRNPQVLALRAGPSPCYTLNGEPVVTAAYCMMTAAYGASTPYVVGKLWDCVVLSEFVPVNGSFQVGGRNYICVCSQNGANSFTVASLLFCVDDNGQPD